jgi:hypothetical protein
VTIRDRLNAFRRRVLLLGLVGALLVGLAAVTAAGPDSALILAVAGSLVLFVGIFQCAFGMHCPRCRQNIGPATLWPPGPWLTVSRTIQRCPACGVRLEEEL